MRAKAVPVNGDASADIARDLSRVSLHPESENGPDVKQHEGQNETRSADMHNEPNPPSNARLLPDDLVVEQTGDRGQ
jgi:hypothetical protein